MTDTVSETEVSFEVWQDGDMVAAADSLADAEHFMLVYGQDGPVEAKTAITTRFPGFNVDTAMLAASPQGEGSSGEAELSQARSNAMSADHIPDAGNMIEPVEAVAWRDIATAPRDGTMLLVGYDEGVAREGAMEDRQRVFEARWNDVQGTWSARNGFLLHSDATHWQPLPHPPSAHPAPIKPSGDTGELRERVALEIRNWPFDINHIQGCLELADAILDLIQSKRAG